MKIVIFIVKIIIIILEVASVLQINVVVDLQYNCTNFSKEYL